MKTQDYLSGLIYGNGILEVMPTAEGYVKNTVVAGANRYNYVYNHTDHLGNVRLSYGQDPVTQEVKILEENNYYPFGMKHKNYNMSQRSYIKSGSGVALDPVCAACPVPYKYNYKYNGKEFQDELGLNLYDYGARNYDPAIGRWMNIDPLAEKSRRFSPYVYALNNPVYFIDPDGMMAEDHKPPKKTLTDQQRLENGALKGVQNRLNDYWNFAKKAVSSPSEVGWDVFEAAAKTVAGAVSFLDDPISSLKGTSDAISNRVSKSSDPMDEMGQVMGEIGTDVVAGELVGAGFARLGGLGVATEELTVFRVFGEDAKMDGFSWTPVHPQSVSDFRGKAGLPSGGQSGKNNSATGMVKGTVQKRKIIEQRPARRLDGNMGKLDEYIIDPKNVKNKRVSDN